MGQPLQGHTDSVSSVAYSPDGAYILSGSLDKTIRIWDARTGQSVGQPLQGHTSWVLSVACSPDGAYILSGSNDNTIRIWDARTGQSVGQPLQGHTGMVSSVAYSLDGAYILSGSSDKTIRIWDARAGQSVGQPLLGHTGGVRSVAFSPDGVHAVSASSDNAVRIWDVRSAVTTGSISALGDKESARTVAPSHSIPTAQYIEPHICSSCCQIDGPHISWALNDDGWVVTHESKLLVWIPPDLRVTLLSPQNTAVLSTRGSLRLDFDHRSIGDHWQEQFRPERLDQAAARAAV
ncbi:hypothetical protein FRC08_004745 [Ceratobasidium sp. 394]|nr:hypothetical protein FRC08_004745 [Ceratobasidium sp. 394]